MYIISLVKKMRIRYKKWARPELEASKFYIDNPEEYKGKTFCNVSIKHPSPARKTYVYKRPSETLLLKSRHKTEFEKVRLVYQEVKPEPEPVVEAAPAPAVEEEVESTTEDNTEQGTNEE